MRPKTYETFWTLFDWASLIVLFWAHTLSAIVLLCTPEGWLYFATLSANGACRRATGTCLVVPVALSVGQTAQH